MVTPLRPAGKGMCGAAAIRVRHTLAVSKFLMASLQVVAFDMAAEAGRQATCGPAGRKHAHQSKRSHHTYCTATFILEILDKLTWQLAQQLHHNNFLTNKSSRPCLGP